MRFPSHIADAVLGEVGNRVFEDLQCHMFDSSRDSNHIFSLRKTVVHCYAKIRLHHLAKQKTLEIAGIAIRKQYSKLILFSHQ